MGVRGVKFSGKKRYEGVRFNVISITRGWVGVQFPGKKRYVTLEWPLTQWGWGVSAFPKKALGRCRVTWGKKPPWGKKPLLEIHKSKLDRKAYITIV